MLIKLYCGYKEKRGVKLMLVVSKWVKETLTEKEIAIAFLKDSIPQSILNQFDLSTLKMTQKSYVTTDLIMSYEDIVYRCNLNTGELGYIPILCLTRQEPILYENMVHQFLEYIVNFVADYLSKGYEYFPIIYPLCIYEKTSSPDPDPPPDIDGQFKAAELFRILVFEPFNLLDLTQYSVSDLEEDGLFTMIKVLIKTKKILRVRVSTVRQDELQAKIDWLQCRLRQKNY
jgi:hypothetical protein